MATVLHITADFPDAHAPGKTPAVRRLLELVPEHNHVVYSLNRVNGLGGARIIDHGAAVSTIVYRAPPYGVLLESHLRPVARLILDDIARRAIRADLVHAHKLTIDGIVADEIARAQGLPLICSVWGNTDQKVIEAKPFSRGRFTGLADRAHALLAATPWAADYVVRRLGVDPRRLRSMPIVSELLPATRSDASGGRVATLFNLDAYAGKNVAGLIEAITLLRQQGRNVCLDILGGGSPASASRIAGMIHGKEDFIALKGPLARHAVQPTLNRYAAFAMPSRRETYGMVFIEALFAGVPILYPQGQSVDGFFDDVDIGEKCNVRSVEDIAHKLDRLLTDEAALKYEIWSLHERGYFARFEAGAIAATYRDVIAGAQARAAAA